MKKTIYLLLLMACATPVLAQRLSTDELRTRGMAVYNALPAVMGLDEAADYTDAVRYLFAYEQRRLRNNAGLEPDVQTAFNWLYAHLDDLKIGKGDQATRYLANDELLDRGMRAYRDVTGDRSLRNGRIWNIPGYIRAVANLYAYVQCAVGGEESASAALSWLIDNRSRLADAGAKGDMLADFGAWRPPERKPGSGVVIVQMLELDPGRRVVQDAPAVDWKLKYEELAEQYDELAVTYAGLERRYEALEARYADVLERLSRYEEQPAESVEDYARIKELHAAGRYGDARDAALMWAKNESQNPAPLLLIARIYTGAVERDGRGRPEDRAVYWLALDYAGRAAKMDAEGRDDALNLMKRLDALAPSPADLEAAGWRVGQRIHIDYPPYEWIGESTTVR